MSGNPVRLPEMNILNGNSTGLIPVMDAESLNLRNNGALQNQNSVKLNKT